MSWEHEKTEVGAFFERNVRGLHYAVRIFIGTAFIWLILGPQRNSQPLWAVISLIFVTEPLLKNALEAFRFRILNTLLGCGLALLFLFIAGPKDWLLPIAVMATAFTATFLPQSPTSWRTAPIAATIVLASGLVSHSKSFGMHIALQRAGEVLLGGIVALCITYVMARIWPLDEEADGKKPGPE